MAFPLLQPPPCFLRWRDELIVTRAGSQSGDGFLIEDPVTGKFHRLGPAEYAVASALDGSLLMPQAAARVAKQDPSLLLAAPALEAFEKWLISAGLVDALIQGQRRTLVHRQDRPRSRSFAGVGPGAIPTVGCRASHRGWRGFLAGPWSSSGR